MLTLLITVLDFLCVQELEISGKSDGRDVKNGVNHDENIKFKDEYMHLTNFDNA